MSDVELFQKRFISRAQAERYRDRYKTGRHARVDQMERMTFGKLLKRVGPVSVALDLPSGVGRLTPLLAEVSQKVILADSSAVMLEIAREDLQDLPAEYLVTDAEKIDLPDQSVDLVFCHRLLRHIQNVDSRCRILRELARVSRRYVILSYYSSGLASYRRWLTRCIFRSSKPHGRPVRLPQFFYMRFPWLSFE